MDWQALAGIVTGLLALAGSTLAVRNSRAAQRDARDQSYVQSAEKRAKDAETRAGVAESRLMEVERRAQQAELRAERADLRLARLEQNEDLNEMELERLGKAAHSMAGWIFRVVDAAQHNVPMSELKQLIDGGPPAARPFRDRG